MISKISSSLINGTVSSLTNTDSLSSTVSDPSVKEENLPVDNSSSETIHISNNNPLVVEESLNVPQKFSPPNVREILESKIKNYVKEVEENGKKKNIFDFHTFLKDTKVERENKKLFVRYSNDAVICCYCLEDKNTCTDINDFDFWSRSVIYDHSGNILATQFNRILKNNEATEFGKKYPSYSNAVLEKCYEGTSLLIYFHESSWRVSTRKCLDASKSIWVKGTSYQKLLEEVIGKVTNENMKSRGFDENNFYSVILVHHKIFSVVDYTKELGKNYKKVFVTDCYEKVTLKKKSFTQESEGISIPKTIENLEEINNTSSLNKRVDSEGFIAKLYCQESEHPVITKFQNALYQRLNSLKPNLQTQYQCYVEMYRKNTLHEYLEKTVENVNEVFKKVKEIVSLVSQYVYTAYVNTHIKKDKKFYSGLHPSYKRFIYAIHGMYLTEKKLNPLKKKIITKQNIESFIINSSTSEDILSVYYYETRNNRNKNKKKKTFAKKIVTNKLNKVFKKIPTKNESFLSEVHVEKIVKQK